VDNKTYTLWKLLPVEVLAAHARERSGSAGETPGDGAGAVILGEFADKEAAHRAFAAAISGLAPGEALQVLDAAGTLWWSHEQPAAPRPPHPDPLPQGEREADS